MLKHKILREFEISKSTYYRLIVREHVLLLKSSLKLKFLLIIFYVLTVFDNWETPLTIPIYQHSSVYRYTICIFRLFLVR